MKVSHGVLNLTYSGHENTEYNEAITMEHFFSMNKYIIVESIQINTSEKKNYYKKYWIIE